MRQDVAGAERRRERKRRKTVNSLTDSSRRRFLRKSLRLLLFVQLLF